MLHDAVEQHEVELDDVLDLQNQDFLRRLGLAPTEEEIAAEDAKKAEKREKIIARKAVILKEREEAKEKAEKRPVRLSAKLALIK